MPVPSIVLGIAISILLGALFHLWKDGGLGKLLLYLVFSLIGFYLGHSLAESLGISFLDAGELHAGFGILDEYRKLFPQRFLNLGISEQNTISFSAGLSLVGYKVFVYNIIPFILYRAYEQVRNDICYQRLPVTLIGIGSGFTYALQGMTHYSLEDIALARTLPNLVIISPSDPHEAEAALTFALKTKQPVYIRISKSGEPFIHRQPVDCISRPLVVRRGKKVAVLFHGSISAEVIKALEQSQVPALALSVPMIQPLDFKTLRRQLRGIHTIITVEEHFLEGGLGSVIADWIVQQKIPLQLKKIGVRNEFVHAIKNTVGMRQLYGISAAHISAALKEGYYAS